jgi:hypothetical protein
VVSVPSGAGPVGRLRIRVKICVALRTADNAHNAHRIVLVLDIRIARTGQTHDPGIIKIIRVSVPWGLPVQAALVSVIVKSCVVMRMVR